VNSMSSTDRHHVRDFRQLAAEVCVTIATNYFASMSGFFEVFNQKYL